VSFPVPSTPAGIVIVAVPPASTVAADSYPPPVTVTVPVGIAFPLPPLTTAVTVKGCVVVMLVAEGVTVTAGVILAGVVTVTIADPDALLYVVVLPVSGVYTTVSVSAPVPSIPAGIAIVAAPPVSAVAAEPYPPPVSVTVPVGTGLPLPPATTTATDKLCAVVIFVAAGVTATVGVIFAAAVTVTTADPAPLL
jgi:hypothetical protein